MRIWDTFLRFSINSAAPDLSQPLGNLECRQTGGPVLSFVRKIAGGVVLQEHPDLAGFSDQGLCGDVK